MSIQIGADYASIYSRNLDAVIRYVSYLSIDDPDNEEEVLVFIANMHDKRVELMASQIGVEDGEDMSISLLRGIDVLLTRYKMVREEGR